MVRVGVGGGGVREREYEQGGSDGDKIDCRSFSV